MASEWTTETIHAERVKSGEIKTKINGKPSKLDVQQLRKRIPPHCLKPSTPRSLLYVIHDITIFLSLLSTSLYLDTQLLTTNPTHRLLLRYILYPALAGLPLTGLWVLAHECGHGAFSSIPLVANTLGWVLHSALLNPYFAWRSSHARHHQFANNVVADLNYVPPTREGYAELFRGSVQLDDLVEDAPLVVLLRIVLQQLVGWPWYLLAHITAGPGSSVRTSRGWWDNSHFLPSSSLFRPGEFWSIVASDVGVGLMGFALYVLGRRYGWQTLVWTYFVPLLWVNHWIVMITYLHHTSPALPKYTPEAWTYLRGALATVDRDPGFVLRHCFHNIIDLHVIHHLFPRIPHYHAQEATDAIKSLLGDYYHVARAHTGARFGWLLRNRVYCSSDDADDDTNRISSVDEKGVLWYRPGPMPRPATAIRS